MKRRISGRVEVPAVNQYIGNTLVYCGHKLLASLCFGWLDRASLIQRPQFSSYHLIMRHRKQLTSSGGAQGKMNNVLYIFF